MLKIRDLRKSFDAAGDGPAEARLQVLDGVALDLAEGETLALRGESGSGKSTLLHVIGALEPADSGSVQLDGIEVTALNEPQAARFRRTTVGLVFQQFNLIPSLSVADNIAFHARLAGRSPSPEALAGLAERLGIAAQLGKFPEALSGGQQQRAALARTLAARPRLILADEPTGNLDEATGDAVLTVMLELTAEIGAGLLMVTHSSRLAARLDRELVLSKGRIA
ncbi:ABC transporter ATP-binding protein [Frigidibacter sp. ROC022]|uniref:ABC transporter ATP-binding protein n=1 Tax=Frigidibacter sp. ROC022 TaxID=2971796 RepID=UPI00215A6EA7|nr:ABC transporter ATP-binding protein [Frigidibacter sp. ROC022]MCR8725052.1 ABC transporter ATP-binding protein [Frigidibacter sp. ROC022]